jgi:hypothetical protein
MNKFHRRVKKMAKHLGNIRPDLPRRIVFKDARSTVKGIIKNVDSDFLSKAW